MPKLKTKSGLKKRFRVTASGKIKCTQAGKRHGMRKRPRRMKRNARGTEMLSTASTLTVMRLAPYLKHLD